MKCPRWKTWLSSLRMPQIPLHNYHVNLVLSTRFAAIYLGWLIGRCDLHRSSPCAFRTVYHNIHLDRGQLFLELIHSAKNLGQKLEKCYFWGIAGISARPGRILKLFGPAYALLCHGQCFQLSSPNLQWLTRLNFKNFYPILGWPSEYQVRLLHHAGAFLIPSTFAASYQVRFLCAEGTHR